MNVVVDASVAAKWFSIEEFSEKAAEVKDAHVRGDFELSAPTHIVYEVGNSILKNQQLTGEDAGEAIASILQLGIRLLAPSTIRAGRTMTIARLRHTTFYDASYLQTAEELRAPLITADESQARAGNGIARIVHLREFTV